jgi:predicted amidohydrolase YtcJ
LVFGYDAAAMGSHLTKDDLERVSRELPIIVWDASQQFVYLNGAAMRKHKITRQTARPPGAILTSDGSLTGQFYGATGAQPILLAELALQLAPDAAGKSLRRMVDLSRQGGITTTSELSFGAFNLDAEEAYFKAFFNDVKTPMRCVAVPHGPTLKSRFDNKAIEYARELRKSSTDKLIYSGVKFSADDAFVSHAMVIENPGYTDGHFGVWHVQPGEEFVDQLSPWWRAGFQIHVDCHGNGGIRATLDALDALQKERPRFDHRFTLEHYGVSTPEHARRARTLGAIASVNPYYLYYYAETTAPAIGIDRAFTVARLRTLLDAGVPTTLHADPPIGPPRPLEWAWIAVNRFARPSGVYAPAEKVSVHQAMRMITIEAAHALSIDEHAGSIQAGKFADFVVLEDNPYEVAPDKLNAVRVWGTVVGGVIYPASEIRP